MSIITSSLPLASVLFPSLKFITISNPTACTLGLCSLGVADLRLPYKQFILHKLLDSLSFASLPHPTSRVPERLSHIFAPSLGLRTLCHLPTPFFLSAIMLPLLLVCLFSSQYPSAYPSILTRISWCFGAVAQVVLPAPCNTWASFPYGWLKALTSCKCFWRLSCIFMYVLLVCIIVL